MTRIVCLALLTTGLGVVCPAGSREKAWPLREQRTIQKSLPLSAEPMRLIVDNLIGYVHVVGTGGSGVEITAHESIHAETESDLKLAQNEVSLDITDTSGTVTAYYKAPWRCGRDQRNSCEDHVRRFYSVTYDIDVKVPQNARIVVSTVNEGDLQVAKVAGSFDVKNVNGSITMRDIGGSGEAHTVNGPVAVHFAKNPAQDCSFKSINGALDIFFSDTLSADLLFKTFNGEIYSDFEVVARAAGSAEIDHKNGKFVYHSNRFRGGRTGRGGPELTFDAFNGDIRLHREQ
jgi:DUF4097 and DUF4098 domain-containing protein YvlB